MAGNGPAPGANPNRKPDGARRNRSKGPQFEELPAEGYTGEYPPLPPTWRTVELVTVENGDGAEEQVSKTRRITFLGPTRDWYEEWATSPMATEFTGVDWQRLKRLAVLVDQFERQPTPKLMAEIRLQEASFGGTPMDRRRLGKRIAQPEEAPAPPKRRGRGNLRAV